MDQFSLHYSDDNKKNTLDNGGNKEHGLKDVTSNGLFPPTETEMDPCMEFPWSLHCTMQNFYYILIRGLESVSVPVENPA